jgi:hypothetical protein
MSVRIVSISPEPVVPAPISLIDSGITAPVISINTQALSSLQNIIPKTTITVLKSEPISPPVAVPQAQPVLSQEEIDEIPRILISVSK